MNDSTKNVLTGSIRNQAMFLVLIPMAFGFFAVTAFVLSNVDAANDIVVKTLLFCALVVVVLFFSATYYLRKFIIRPMEELTASLKGFESDRSRRIAVSVGNEIGELARLFNSYADNLDGTLVRLSGAITGIDSFASSISASVAEHATVASEQSASVAEITATTEELSASASQIAEHAASVVHIADKTWEDTKNGAMSIESVIMKMNEIYHDNKANIEEIIELGRKSKEISKVMTLINTIADQTKLIAFNAALEAASAGEAGRRFGVVASEIRRLADSVMESTGEIEGKVSEIQVAINRLVVASEKSSKGIMEGLEHSGNTAALLSDMVEAAQTTTDAAKQISLSTQQQKTASSQVATALREIVEGSCHIAASIRQISEATSQFSALSKNLKDLVGQAGH